jgi:hypothetical protein
MLTDHRHVANIYGGKLSAPLYTVEGGIDVYLKIIFEINLSNLLSSVLLLTLSRIHCQGGFDCGVRGGATKPRSGAPIEPFGEADGKRAVVSRWEDQEVRNMIVSDHHQNIMSSIASFMIRVLSAWLINCFWVRVLTPLPTAS